MAIHELEVFPQIRYSEGQGLVGVRKWTLDANDDWEKFLDIVSASHWPGEPDAIPVDVQAGAFWDGVNIKCVGDATRGNIGPLPQYGKYMVVAQYALHRMTNCWPDKFPKPRHYRGTTLTLKVRGSGQYLLISPAGVRSGANPYIPCNQAVGTAAGSMGVQARFAIPIVEHHITCDRMTLQQVNKLFGHGDSVPCLTSASFITPSGGTDYDPGNDYKNDWDIYLGCVNSECFLGAPPETLLFDGYEVEETYVADSVNPRRYRLTACLKQRVISGEDGLPLYNIVVNENEEPEQQFIGWNHDYMAQWSPGDKDRLKPWGWTYITMVNAHDVSGDPGDPTKNRCGPRYPLKDFKDIFYKNAEDGVAECDSSGSAGSDIKNLC